MAQGISTHTPLAGRDQLLADPVSHGRYFYSHAPCGARLGRRLGRQQKPGFLLTRPLRGATRCHSTPPHRTCISTHTPLAGRDTPCFSTGTLNIFISTHTPLAGRDEPNVGEIKTIKYFYSHAPCGARPDVGSPERSVFLFLLTRPLRGATHGTIRRYIAEWISTHTPLAGRDTK